MTLAFLRQSYGIMDIHCLELSNALFIYRSSVCGDDNILTNTYVYEMLVSSATKFNEFLFAKTSHHIFKNVSTHWMATAMTTLFCPILGCFMQCTPISFIQLSTCCKTPCKTSRCACIHTRRGHTCNVNLLANLNFIWKCMCLYVCLLSLLCTTYKLALSIHHIISYHIIWYHIPTLISTLICLWLNTTCPVT